MRDTIDKKQRVQYYGADNRVHMRATIKSKGIYIFYDERRNDDVCEAITISNRRDYLIWFYPCLLDIDRLSYPSEVTIKIKKEERYFRGELTKAEKLTPARLEELKRDTPHRPYKWLRQPDSAYKKFKVVLFIKNLERLWNPSRQIRQLKPIPCHHFY